MNNFNKDQFVLHLDYDYDLIHRNKEANKIPLVKDVFNLDKDNKAWNWNKILKTSSIKGIVNKFKALNNDDTNSIQPMNLKLKLQWDNIKFIFLCLAWYLSSSITNNFGKLILIHFNYPLTMTVCQFFMVALFGVVMLSVTKSHSGKGFNFNSWIFNYTFPLALFQVLSHIFNSYALSLIPVSIVFTFKTLSPLFTVLLNKLLFNKNYTLLVYISLIPITSGVILFCLEEIHFNLLGCIFAIISCLIYVLQSIYTKHQIFDQTNQKSLTQLELLFYSSCLAFISSIPIWMFMEAGTIRTIEIDISYFKLTNYFIIKGISQALQAWISFTLLANTDTVSFTIISLLKRMVIVICAMIFFHQPIGIYQAFALIITFSGLYIYEMGKKKHVKTNLV